MRHLWIWVRVWVWVCLLVMGVTRVAEAEEEGFLPLPVCVRPPNVDKSIILWSYWAGGHTQVRRLNPGFAAKRYPQPTFLYDPNAPPENTKALPEPYKKLPCDPKPPPPEPPPEPEKTKPKKEAPKQEGSGTSGSSGHGEHDEKGEKKDQAQNAPPAPREAPSRAAEEEGRHPRLPAHGVTTDWPKSVLPTKEALLPTKRRDDPCAWVLPWPGQKAVNRAQACPGNGEGNGDGTKAGVKKTWAEKAAESLAYTAGGLNLQFDEDLKRPDGKQYGVMGGRNPQGPNNPVAQAVASGVMITAAVLSLGAESFRKKLMSAAAKGTPLLMKEMEKVGLDVAEELATKLGRDLEAEALQKGEMLEAGEGAKRIREALARTLAENRAIGPYEVMKQFTDTLSGQYQAHHILEVQWANKFTLGNADKMPAVILTEAEHKRITASLATRAKKLKIKNATDLWAAYEEAYIDHPEWLAAIKKYFIVKGK